MLTVASTDIARWLGEFFWPFLRIMALMATAPGFSSPAIPVRAKVALALAVAILIGATLNQSMPVTMSWVTVELAIEQVLVGVAIGFAMQLTLAAMAFAGEFVGVQMGFGFASLLDVQTGFDVPVMSNFFSLTGLMLFLALNGHLVLLGVLVKSFTVVPIAANSGISSAGWRALARAGVLLFQMGVWLALPVIAVLLAAHLTVAVISRVAPQFNIMSLGFSLFLWVGIASVIAVVPFFIPAVQHMIEAGLTVGGAALQGQSP
ncbi:MAG TPA: flagellar biosynthetic protein FliR [Stellaceae bacterium]|nr:flagellar biosynthetic protein FliR [Stellaceae bacterium]